MGRILIRNATVLSMDADVGDFPSADILIVDDRIALVQPDIKTNDAEIIEARDMIALPGLVNAHHHTWETGLRGIASDWAGTDYRDHMHHGMALQFEAGDNYTATLFGALAQIDGGTTTLFDWCHNLRDAEMADASIDALEESGIRAVFGHGMAKPLPVAGAAPYWETPHSRAEIHRLRTGRLSSDERLVTLAMAILGPDLGTYDVACADLQLAREYKLMTSAHTWGRPGQRRTPDGMLRLAAAGLLGPDHNLVHGNNLDDAELKTILDTGCSVTATPLAEMLTADRTASLGRVAAFGGRPSLGTDLAPHFSAAMLPVIRHAFLHQRETDNRKLAQQHRWPPTRHATSTRTALEWGTLGGARALRLDDRVGSLTPGKLADIVLLRTDGMHLHGVLPGGNPAHAVVMYAEQGDVDTVIIGGTIRKRAGRLCYPAASLDKLRGRLLASRERIMHGRHF